MTGPFDLLHLRSAVFSADRHHRYWLTRIWDRTRPVLVTCMFNPSTADGNNDDPTIGALCAFAKLWGYGGILVVNLRSLRSPDPQTIRLREAREPGSTCGDAQPAAWKHALALAETQATPVLCAWGALALEGEADDFVKAAAGLALVCLGTTANGSPKHPLARGKHRIPRDQQPLPWTWVA